MHRSRSRSALNWKWMRRNHITASRNTRSLQSSYMCGPCFQGICQQGGWGAEVHSRQLLRQRQVHRCRGGTAALRGSPAFRYSCALQRRWAVTSVADPWNFGTDLDPLIQTSDLWIRIWIRMQIWILLFSSVTFKTSTKFIFLSKFVWYFLFEGTFR